MSLNILRVVQSLYPEVVGGIGVHAHEMSQAQSAMGHEVSVVTTDNGEHSLPREEERDGYTLYRLKEMARPFDNSLTPGIVPTIHSLAPEHDVIHAHSHFYFMSNISTVLGAISSSPVVVTNHGLVSQTAPLPIQKVFTPTIGRLTFEASDRVLCYTKTDKSRLEERGVSTDISVIPNGIDCDRFQPNGSEPRPQILFVGRLKPGKGAGNLIRAFARLENTYPSWNLEIVGDGPLRSELVNLADSLGLHSRVSFVGEVPNAVLPQLYNESAVFALPSSSEGLPRTVLEAMACKTPVVVSDLDQLRPVVDGAGLTASPESIGKLADALAHAMDNPDVRRYWGETGRSRVEESYSWESTVRDTTRVYERLVNGDSG